LRMLKDAGKGVVLRYSQKALGASHEQIEPGKEFQIVKAAA